MPLSPDLNIEVTLAIFRLSGNIVELRLYEHVFQDAVCINNNIVTQVIKASNFVLNFFLKKVFILNF